MRVARESWVLGGICALDLVSTLWLVDQCGAQECHALMRYYLSLGYLPFIAAKMLLVLGPLAVLEWARRRRPEFVQSMLRCAIVLYVGLYASVVWTANHMPKEQEDLAAIDLVVHWAGQPTTPSDVARARGAIATMTSVDSR
jgi:hypothetical protein